MPTRRVVLFTGLAAALAQPALAARARLGEIVRAAGHAFDVPRERMANWFFSAPMKRMGLPEELQGAVVYLASEAASYTTGADIIIYGGYSSVSRVEALGSAPDARAYFFLSCQEKVAKKKSRPQRRPATPGSLRCSGTTGGLRNSGRCPSDSPRPFSRCALRCSTTQRAD